MPFIQAVSVNGKLMCNKPAHYCHKGSENNDTEVAHLSIIEMIACPQFPVLSSKRHHVKAVLIDDIDQGQSQFAQCDICDPP
jgi:hypothetical protein